MLKQLFFKSVVLILLCFDVCLSQVIAEVYEPPHIKSIVFKQTDEQQFPVVALGTPMVLEFDDLNGDEKNYYYKIKYFNHDWTPSNLFESEFLDGFDNLRIENYQTSFNTLQPYTHYRLDLPNEQTKIKLSGNYMLEVYDEDDLLVFSRRFLVYENQATVSAGVYRPRDFGYYNTHQSVQFSINPEKGTYFRDPENQVHVVVLQNEQWGNAISEIKPQFISGTKLEYRYNEKTRFEGGNEYLFFDTKDIRITGSNVSLVELNRLYESYLSTDLLRRGYPYSYAADINGDFVVRTVLGNRDSAIEADYSWVHFSIATSAPLEEEIYIYGKFNNYNLGEENRMYYNPALEIYEGILLLKQGIYNYKYVTKTEEALYLNGVSGTHALTENSYLILVYYRNFGTRHDALIGIGNTSSFEIID